MAFTKSQPSNLYARDIVQYSDAELDEYLEVNRRLVEVEDPENLPEDFIQRLRLRAGASDTVQSHPVDLSDLTARLQQVSADRQARPRPSSLNSDFRSRETTASSIDEEELYRRHLKREMEFYNTLVNEGGRPSHPISLLGPDILNGPEEYREILSYWQNGREEEWGVFGQQMSEWQYFRRWQGKNRDGRFLKYVKDVKQGLAEHEFTRPFQLDEDPERQDKLTTWIEFIDYEYWWYDKDMRVVKRHQPRYDEAWKKLVDLKVLKPLETEEFICNIDSSFQHASEEDRAEEVVKSAKSAMMSAQKAIADPRRSNLSQREPRQRLAEAQSKLDAAIKSLESIKRRNDLVSEFHQRTRRYQIAKDEVERRSILLRWILQQVPLIELELNQAKVVKNIGVRRRSKRNRADESNEERVSKRQSQDGESNPISDRRTRTSTAKERESQLKRSLQDSINEAQASKRLRRNSQNHSLFLCKTPDAADRTSIREPHSIQPDRSQGSRATTARSEKRSVRCSAPKRTRSEVKTLARVVLDEKAQVMNRGIRGGLSNLWAPPLRRSTRVGKQPDRFK